MGKGYKYNSTDLFERALPQAATNQMCMFTILKANE